MLGIDVFGPGCRALRPSPSLDHWSGQAIPANLLHFPKKLHSIAIGVLQPHMVAHAGRQCGRQVDGVVTGLAHEVHRRTQLRIAAQLHTKAQQAA